jgi:glyoxylase-like metal-dependent hydrolase (beta-lactamase superfamily II)
MSAPWHIETGGALVRKVTVGPYENNAYVVACRATRKAVLIDAAAEADRLVAECQDVEVEAILTTHGHLDHVGAAREVADRLAGPFRLHEADLPIAEMRSDEPLTEGDLAVGELVLDVRHTPGHTPGSMCIVTEGLVFSGDTLFPGGPGATRFAYSSFDEIIASLERRLFTLDDATLVMPGHGLDTTIGTERPSLGAWVERGW